MRWRSSVLVLVSLGLIAGWGCGPQPDVTAVKFIPQISGYVYGGKVTDGAWAGQDRLLPSITFKLKNEGTLPIEYVDVTVAFWHPSEGEQDSKLIHAIDRAALAPGAETDTLTVQAANGYTSPTVPAEFFSNPSFVDLKVKVFARRAGKHASLGELAVERRILPSTRKDGLHP